MKKIIPITLSILSLVAVIQWVSLPDQEPNKQALATGDSPELPTSESGSVPRPTVTSSNIPAEKQARLSDVELDEAAASVAAAARAVAYQQAMQQFESLDATEKREKRKIALNAVIAGNGIDIGDEIALQQSWQRAGRAEPGYQHKKDSSKVDVNGTIVDVSTPGIVVANSVMVYIPKDQSALVAELASVVGIKNIEPLFVNAKPSTTPGVRDLSGWQQIELSAPASRIKSIVSALKSFEGVSEAEPVYERKLSITGPLVSDLDDPKMDDQWHLEAAKVKEAWAYLESKGLPGGGDDSIVVAVIDTGVDYNHPDLKANMWVNTQEIPGNNVDDDNNGFVDDIHGAAVVSESYSHSGDPDDDHGHGTHVAGIIASTGANGIGGVGVAYNSKIMAIKAAQYSGVLTTADIAEGIYYAVDNGADVINMSFGGYGRSQVEEDALATAYSNTVLVAAAGNDGRPNDSNCRGGAPMYPGAYAWVLGVMARTEFPNADGDYLASFSNWDCTPSNGLEYEVMAPGKNIWSALPDGSYTKWSGTSMAAPVVTGMAALARTRWPDKATFSSRFIMGQLGATGGDKRGFKPIGASSVKIYKDADAYSALTSVPKPELSYEEHWLFDEVGSGSGNDGDGRVDAGESIELAIVIRNRWGRADNVVVALSTPSGAAAADPFVTFQTDSVNYGAVGSFNKDDNGIEYNDDLLVTGVRNPFAFSVAENTPNNHIIPFTLTITSSSGLDSDNTEIYEDTATFQLVVQRGRELPSIIGSDAAGTDGGNLDTDGIVDGIVTLDDSALWIVDKPVLVEHDTTVKITEGAQIQFWSSQPDNTYVIWRPAYIQVEGTLDIEGTVAKPVRLYPSSLFPTRMVQIFTAGTGTPTINLQYAKVSNICAGENYANASFWNKVNFNNFDRLVPESLVRGCRITDNLESLNSNYVLHLPRSKKVMTGNRYSSLGYEYKYATNSSSVEATRIYGSNEVALLDNTSFDLNYPTKNTVFLKNQQSYVNGYGDRVSHGSSFSNISIAVQHVAVEPMIHNGKTYALFYSKDSSRDYYHGHIGTIHHHHAFARNFAQYSGGSLMTPSSAAEVQAVQSWLRDVIGSTNEYWENKYPFCVTTDGKNFCKSRLGGGLRSLYHLGAIRQEDGSYSWGGETEGYDYLGTQPDWNESKAQAEILVVGAADFNLPEGYNESESNGWAFSYILEVPGELSQEDLDSKIAGFKNQSKSLFQNNAILNVWRDLTPSTWAVVNGQSRASSEWDITMVISGNYWGGAGDSLIDIAITDYSDDFNKSRTRYKPVLTSSPSSAYPFVVNAEVLNAGGVRPSGDRFGAQASKWRVTFNRDMDITKQPRVTFGPAEPFSDFFIPGDWVDARTWEGTFTFSAITGDGWQNIRVVGAVAADNAWLVTGDDSERFQFELITSGTEALTLQASGARGSVSLSWMQDDFELLHGYNLYRSLSEDGIYTRVNSSTIDKSITSFPDTDVIPGVEHYYYFTVVSDSGESSPSNIAIATPVDTVLPVVTHRTESVVSLGDSLTLRAIVTDNIAVTAVNIFFRNASGTVWQNRVMTKTDSNRYSITLSGSDIGNQYLEYYIEVKDSSNIALSGSAESPYRIYVSLPSDTDTDGDGVSNAEDAFPYNPNESGDLDGDGVGDNTDPDNDGDGVQNGDDAFPTDGGEWSDADSDGTGDNADADDDNDGVEDYQDRFPKDNRGSIDSDGDGLPNRWETENGLNPNDAADSDSDADFDGYTALEEFTARTSPMESDQKTQIVFIEADPFVAGFTNTMSVYYRSSDGTTGLNGLGIRLHYNSQLIDVFALKNLLLVDLIAADSVAMPDSADFDNDPLTDSYLTIAWAVQSGSSWPGVVPVKLFDLAIDFSEQVTASDKINIGFSATSTHPGYGFSGVRLNAQVNLNSLDIDGDGSPDALSDGLLILRSMFGLTGEALIQNAVSPSAQYVNSSNIVSRINGLGLLLDVDGNSKVDPLSDGLLVLRYLFGIHGETLINNVIAPDATRVTSSEIEAYLEKMAPNK